MKLELNRRDLQEPVLERLQQHCWLLATQQRNMLKYADYRLEKYCLVGCLEYISPIFYKAVEMCQYLWPGWSRHFVAVSISRKYSMLPDVV